MPSPSKFRLYVAGFGPHSVKAREALAAFCEQHLEGRHEIELVDVLREPQRAQKEGVRIAPLLIQLGPGPAQKLVGSKPLVHRSGKAQAKKVVTANPKAIVTPEREAAIAALLDEIDESENKLERLLQGEVDAVIPRKGSFLLLHRPEKNWRETDAQRQVAGTVASILDSLPAHIALLDASGNIQAVNEAWLKFAEAHPQHGMGHEVDQNYLATLAQLQGKGVAEAQQMAAGIRAVLNEESRHFSLEYPLPFAATERWFRVSVTPLHERGGQGAVVMHVDVTEEHLAEEKLRQSENLLSIAGRAARLGGWSLELAGREIRWSDEACRIHDLPPGTTPTRDQAVQCYTPECQERLIKAAEECIRNGTPFDLELEVITSQGRHAWVRTIGHAERNPAGVIIRVQGAFQDITERKAVKEELEASEERFSSAFAYASIGMAIVSPEGRWLKVNRALCWIVGYSEDELLKMTFQDITYPEDLGPDLDKMRGMLAGEIQFCDIEKRYFHKKGHLVRVLLSYSLVRDSRGQPLYFISQIQDITERKRTEERIAEQAALLDKAPDAIFVRDLHHLITYWNKSAERIYQWTKAEALGKSALDLIYRDPSGFNEAMEILLQNGEWSGELEQFDKAGHALIIEERWTLVRDENGSPKSVMDINTDVSERKKMEDQFLRAQRLESIGTLASGIAHDLNNVLAPIMMSVELLGERVTDDESRALLATLKASSTHGADLVKQVLAFARGMEGQRLTLNPEHLLRDVQKIIRDTFPKNIRLRFTADRDLWTVTGDPTQLHQVFMNLCVNARDAMPDGGKLTITMENVVLDQIYCRMHLGCEPGPYVLIKVEDTGVGIPKNIRDRIFEPFFTTKEVGSGTGLGLSTTLTVVQNHGGFIDLTSEPGHGTIFRVYLPTDTISRAMENESPGSNLPEGHGEWVMVVDDEEGIRSVTQKTLERFGYHVLLAANGAEAVSLYAMHKSKIAVVLTDMAMPVMDGPAMVVALRTINPKVKIIASSGLSSTGGIAKVAASGVAHFIPKPYTTEIMLKVLADTLKMR